MNFVDTLKPYPSSLKGGGGRKMEESKRGWKGGGEKRREDGRGKKTVKPEQQ